jgi:hypothetical protein
MTEHSTEISCAEIVDMLVKNIERRASLTNPIEKLHFDLNKRATAIGFTSLTTEIK